jgi:hypothetical protein
VYPDPVDSLYCPLCGQALAKASQEDRQRVYKVLYQHWAEVERRGPPPKLPPESIHWVCNRGCFTEDAPLVLHHATAGARFAPSDDSWALTYRGPGVYRGMDELTNTEKTVLAHLSLHHRIQPWEPAVKKIFGGDEAARKQTLTSLRDRGWIKHYKYARHDLQFITASDKGSVLGSELVFQARKGDWKPENIELGE